MATVDAGNELFQLEEVSPATPENTLAQARELLLEYGRFVVTQPGTRLCFGSLEKEADRLPFSYIEQGGGCLLAKVRQDPVGFVAWHAVPANIAPDAWEMKRLWVRPNGRGQGLGLALTHEVLDRALAAGRKAVYLDYRARRDECRPQAVCVARIHSLCALQRQSSGRNRPSREIPVTPRISLRTL
jgi:GNAT superfamily N-acetyltransferase